MPPVQPRSELNDIGYYMVGISKLPGFDRIIKLSSNESPLGASPAAIAAAKSALEKSHLYPEVDTEVLNDVLARRFSLDPACIAFGPGSDELLFRIVNAFAGFGDELIHSEHAYMQFPIYARRAGVTPVAARDDQFRHSVDQMLSCVTPRTRVVMIANPDNPSGTYLGAAEVRRLREELPEQVLLVLDSAYDEYAAVKDYESGINLVAEYDNVIVTRTFSKLFGLAGLRLGWCYAATPTIDLLQRIGPSFPVNVAANAAAIGALEDVTHTRTVLGHNARWREWFAKELKDMGLTVYPSQTNFVLVRFPRLDGKTARDADEFLQARGIVGRRFALRDFRDKLRFTVGLDWEMREAASALRDFLTC